MRSTLAPIVLAAVAALASVACSAEPTNDASTEDDVTSAARLTPTTSSPELARALADASEASGTILEVATFTYDAARVKDPVKVTSAVRAKLAHARLRQDEGAAGPVVLSATLEEYGVEDASHRDAIAAALRSVVGDSPASRKLWLRSDDVPDAESEWAEVVLVYVVPAKGLAVTLTVRYEA